VEAAKGQKLEVQELKVGTAPTFIGSSLLRCDADLQIVDLQNINILNANLLNADLQNADMQNA
jgi:uncharacterized protein YjbI with pentapeptide repeats